jgi:hypothetical protein
LQSGEIQEELSVVFFLDQSVKLGPPVVYHDVLDQFLVQKMDDPDISDLFDFQTGFGHVSKLLRKGRRFKGFVDRLPPGDEP